jgi:hypothetical protein
MTADDVLGEMTLEEFLAKKCPILWLSDEVLGLTNPNPKPKQYPQSD